MPSTAKKHFDEDIGRARALVEQAHLLPDTHPPSKLLKEDVLRSGIMFGVGAVDAYFCDAYADIVAKILRAKTSQNDILLPPAIENTVLPVSAFFHPASDRENWKWRMAARGIVEKDNVLSLSKIQQLFNPFFRKGHKVFDPPMIDKLIVSHNAPSRVTGMTRTEYRQKGDRALHSARKSIKSKIKDRYTKIFQRRHDCIHNCDRPKLSMQSVSYTRAEKVVTDLNLLVSLIDPHIESEFNQLLDDIGCSAVTKNSVSY